VSFERAGLSAGPKILSASATLPGGPSERQDGTWRRSATDAERIGTRVDYPQGRELPEQDPERFKAGIQPPCVLGVIVLNCPNKSMLTLGKSPATTLYQALPPASPASTEFRYHGRTDAVVNLPRRKRSRLFESGFAHNMA
jgi:hypothetical protein